MTKKRLLSNSQDDCTKPRARVQGDRLIKGLKMKVSIFVDHKESEAEVEINNSDQDSMAWLTLRDGKKEISTLVCIDDLTLALRKISAT